jgi:hypothetical protein
MIMTGSEAGNIRKAAAPFRRFLELSQRSGAGLGLVIAGAEPGKKPAELLSGASGPSIFLDIPSSDDPLGLRCEVGLKMLLNAHSTAVMTRLGKVIGNTMTNVSPSNLKLIGRATYLIQSHVNDFLSRPDWLRLHGRREPITYGEANAVLFEAIGFLKDRRETAGQTAEVALSTIRILESLRQTRGLTNDEALGIVLKVGLDKYLAAVD